MNSNRAQKPPIRKWECMLIVSTILTLACAVVLLIGCPYPFAAAGQEIKPSVPHVKPAPIAQGPAEPEQQEPAPAHERVRTNLAPHVGAPYAEFVGPIILTAAVVIALTIAGTLVLVFAVLGLLRWHSRRFGAPLLRIEHVGASPIALQSFSPSALAAPLTRPLDAAPAPQRTDAAVARAEDPMIQRLLEDALELQAQINLARNPAS